MMHRILLFSLMLLALSVGCSSDPAKPDPKVDTPSVIFYEPLSFCSRDEAGVDSLGLFNLGDSTLVLSITAPDWMEDMPLSVTIPPDHYANLRFLWRQQLPPVVDSVVVESGDERLVIPVNLLRLGTPDPARPAPPLLALPRDESVFSVGGTIEVWWSRTDNCSPGAQYQLQVATDPTFATRTIVLNVERLTQNFALLDILPGDEGPAYWRVGTKNGVGTTYSKTRSWVVEPVSTPSPK